MKTSLLCILMSLILFSCMTPQYQEPIPVYTAPTKPKTVPPHPIDKYTAVTEVQGFPNEILNGFNTFLESNSKATIYWNVKAFEPSLDYNEFPKVVEVDSSSYIQLVKKILPIDLANIPSVTKKEVASMQMTVNYTRKLFSEGNTINNMTIRNETVVIYLLEDLSTNIVLGENKYAYVVLEAIGYDRKGETKIIINKWE